MKPENIPESLRRTPNWVLWREIFRNDEPTKVPFQITGAEAKSNDPMTWSPFKDAFERFERGGFNGMGFMFCEQHDFIGIDLDGCRNPDTGEWAEWAREIIERFASYTELSPSKTGAKIFIRGKSPFSSGKNIKLPDAPVVSGKKPGIEVYSKLRYFTCTGLRLKSDSVPGTVEERQEAIEWLAEKYAKRQQQPSSSQAPLFAEGASVFDRARKYLERMPVSISGSGGHNAAFHAACVLTLGFGLSRNDAFTLLQEWNVGCKPAWSERELQHKLDDAEKQVGPRNYLRDARPENWDRVRIPTYRAPKAMPAVQVTTMQDAATAYLERVANGSVKLIELGLPDVDHAMGGGVEAGELILFAGRPGHGKSVGAQQITDNFTARYGPAAFFSEEMGFLALGKRAISRASDIPTEYWTHRTDAVTGHLNRHFDGKHPCYIVEGCRTADRVATELERFVKDKGVGLAVVDYAQILAGTGNGRYEAITNVSITLKQAAKACNIPLIVLCQMSRAIETRASFIPVLSDLKESGQLEQDADVVCFQVWPWKLDSNRDMHEYLIFVAKNRNRPIDSPCVKCRFMPSRQTLVYERGQSGITAAEEFPQPDWGISDNSRLEF